MKGMMTVEEYKNLKAGDLLVWRGAYLRTVIEPPEGRSGNPLGNITLSIRRRSWTNRATTIYGYHDLKWVAFPAGKKIRSLMLGSELEVLKSLNFDVRKEIKREFTEEIDRKKRMGKEICKNAMRIARLAKIKFA
jgi:hypothetical protein